MKIIHVPFCFPPDPIGGTEVYVETLARRQQDHGIEVVIAAPESENRSYIHNGLSVHRFAVSESVQDLHDLYGAGDKIAAINFANVLDKEQPDLVHLHTFTRATSLRTLEQVQQRNIPLVFTYHLPGVSCQRGTLMRWGTEPCDGEIRLHTCARCLLHSHGLPRIPSNMLGSVPVLTGRLLGNAGCSGGFWTALRTTELLALRRSTFQHLVNSVDAVIVLCDWTRQVLVRNGVDTKKIVLSRHGIYWTDDQEDTASNPKDLCNQPLRVAFLGRLAPLKGVDILVNAIRQLQDIPISLDCYAIVQNVHESEYQQQVIRLVQHDKRINFLPSIANDQVIHTLKQYDILAVPSQWFETGPLVVLESFAAGVPVLGSDLGGIAELVHNQVDGLLVQHNDVDAWSQALYRLATDCQLRHRLRLGVRPPRKIDTVVDEMLIVYDRLCKENQSSD